VLVVHQKQNMNLLVMQQLVLRAKKLFLKSRNNKGFAVA
jgi:hypothetical protein